MALIKCSECEREISDKAGKCPHCGYPIETKSVVAQEIESEPLQKKKPVKRIFIVAGIIAAAVIIGVIAYFFATNDQREYEKAQQLYSSEKYEDALDKFASLATYKDSKNMVEKCEYAISVDGRFLIALSKGLMKRWDYSDKEYVEEFGKEYDKFDASEYVEYVRKCIEYELEKISGFQSETFTNSNLGTDAKSYINLLNDCLKATDYYIMDLIKYNSLWNELYSKRSVLIRKFVQTYDLTVDEKHQKNLDGFIANASVVDEQEAIDKEISEMVAKFVLTPTTNEWGLTTYRLSMENTTKYTFEYFYVDISALDVEGNIVGTGNISQITNWTSGQKAEVDAWINIADVSKIASTTYSPHYKSGNYYK